MAYPIWQATITDGNGNVLPGAEITVVNETTGLNATLFSTRNGTSKTNPFFATVDGFAQFYAEPGLYRITATDGGTGTTQTFRYVRLVEVATPAEALAGTAGVLPDAAGVHAAFKQFGLGDPNVLSSGTDIDSLRLNGLYGINSGSFPKIPVSVPGTLLVTNYGGASFDRTVQMYFAINNRIFSRSNGGGGWGAWVELRHSGNILGTVSQSGGVPTGAIIERGSNANGEFVKYADGTLICWAFSVAVSNPNIPIGNIFRSDTFQWTFPHAFVGNPNALFSVLSGTATLGVWAGRYDTIASITATYARSALLSAISGVSVAVSGSAIGRWY